MSCHLCNRVQSSLRGARQWPLWQLPSWLISLVAIVTLADAAGLAVAIRVTSFGPGAVLLCAALMVSSAVTVEMTRRLGEAALVFKDVGGVWELPAAVLLPPMYAMLLPLVRIALTQARVRKIAPHRRVFTAAAYSLAYGGASVFFHQLSGTAGLSLGGSPARAAAWILLVAAAGVVQWLISNLFIMAAVKGSDRSASIRQVLLGRQNMYDDMIEMSVAVVVAVGAAASPVLLVFALPFVTLLQRSMRHSQLVDASRIDAKTGLLNAVTWRRESSGELTRAQRTGAGLAVALIDIDHFKAVNDSYGHLAGDEALHAISETIKQSVREYDLVGRFGGEEFSLLMPQTDAADALRVAERIRAQVAALTVEPPPQAAGGPISLTVSIGVAMADDTTTGITELLAAADVCLYRAKASGRDQVYSTMPGEQDGRPRRPSELPVKIA